MWSFLKKRKQESSTDIKPIDFSFLGCDMHSHLIPGIDDGAKTAEDSIELIKQFKARGYKKLITTPHVHGDFYNNTSATIKEGLDTLKDLVAQHQIEIELEAAAEYYLDNYFQSEVLPNGLLSFGDNYVLVEVSMAGWPRNFDELIFSVQSLGYKPILAHPERYLFEESIKTFDQLKNKGVLLQMNLLSLFGYYGRSVKHQAEELMDMYLYDFCGTDVHHIRHMEVMGKMQEHPTLMHRIQEYGFRNDYLLNH